jgi:geranylgeranyl diphosphate synthase type 3
MITFFTSKLQKLLQPFTYYLQVPGKQFLQKWCHAFNYWLEVPVDKLNLVRDIAAMLKTANEL